MGKRLVIFSIITAAIALAGCGKKTPTATAPIAVGVQPATTSAASTATDSSMLTGSDTSATTGLDTTTSTDTTTDSSASTAATPSPTATPTATPTPTPAPTATPTPSPTATPTPSPTPTPTPTATPDTSSMIPQVVKDIGNGSLNSSHGLAVSGGYLFVVDNNRTGLLGKFAAVRKYEIASGTFETSFENTGWAGAKNMPTSVTNVRINQGNVEACDSTTTYVYALDASLVLKSEGTFPLVTSVVDPITGDTYRLAGSKIERVHNGTVLLSFGEGTITEGEAIAVGADGTLFVSEKSKGLVHQFAAAKK